MDQPLRIKIAISSVKKFSLHTLPVIIPSLLQSIEPQDIFIFEGGYDERWWEIRKGITHIRVAHNSFDYTALIDIVENELESDYWFLLHDTCKAGPDFGKLVRDLPEGEPDVVCMLGSNPGTMNICAYKYNYLLSRKQDILDLKNTDYEDLDSAKRRATEAENTLQEGCVLYHPELFETNINHRVASIYTEDGVNRNERYFKNLDITKYQANYGDAKFVLNL
jgi:hypothetical protein